MVVRTMNTQGWAPSHWTLLHQPKHLHHSGTALQSTVYTLHPIQFSHSSVQRPVRTVTIYKNIRTITSGLFHPSFKTWQTIACRAVPPGNRLRSLVNS